MQRRKHDLLHGRVRSADHFQLAHQRMGRINFVVSVCTEQHQVPHIRLGQKILEQVEGCRIEPLQIVEEESKGMLRSREYSNESPKDQLEAAMRVLWRKIGNRRLVSYDELQFRDKVYNEQSVRA